MISSNIVNMGIMNDLLLLLQGAFFWVQMLRDVQLVGFNTLLSLLRLVGGGDYLWCSEVAS